MKLITNQIIFKLFPELARLPTEKARLEAWSIAKRKVVTSWQYWTAIVGIVIPSVMIQFSFRRLGIPSEWRGIVRWLIVAVTIIACWTIFLAFGKTIRRTLWRVFLDYGIPCCASCGYDLRLLPINPADGLTVCSESGSGWKLDARVSGTTTQD